MRTRAVHSTAHHIAVYSFGAVLVGAFGFLFLSTAPVRGVTDLYWGLHLDSIMTLDDLFGLGHIVIYAGLAMACGRFTRTVGGWVGVLVALGALGYGVEVAQRIVGGRSYSLDDMVADLVGICAGFLVLVIMGPPRARRRRRR